MQLDLDGLEFFPNVLRQDECNALVDRINSLAIDSAGSRDLLTHPWCRELAQRLADADRLGALVAGLIPVQCTYFDKSAESNWLVAYHQDLSIPVRARVPSPNCSGWSTKGGIIYVQPPLSVLESLVAVRLHLDDSREDNGPLRALVGSHRLGRIKEADIPQVRKSLKEVTCLSPRGGAIALRPLLLHASSKSRTAASRRVLHLLFGPFGLPEGLQWWAPLVGNFSTA